MTSSSAADRARLSVACVSVSAALGGSEWSLLDFLRRAAGQEVDAALLVPKEGALVEAARTAGVRVAVAEASPTFLDMSQRATLDLDVMALTNFSRGLFGWARAIRRESLALFGHAPAVLYTNGFKAHLAATLVRGPRRVWHVREFPPEHLGFAWRTLAGVLPTSCIANSRAVAEAWRPFVGRAPSVVYNGVDLERFRPTSRTYWLHDHLGLTHDVPLVGMPAIFAKWKGHLQVVEAFERAATRSEAQLVLVGGAIYDTRAERGFAEELVGRVRRSSQPGTAPRPLSDRIHFVKHQSEPWRLYPEFDVVVHFSTRPEPFGRVVAESLACGVPPIAARAGGPTEIVDEGVTGWLVPPGDVGALSDAIVHALEVAAGAEGARMRAACRQAAEQRFSADRYAQEVAHALRAAAGVPA
jgi:glycosyltransferase involved in cell wall biosynthesis